MEWQPIETAPKDGELLVYWVCRETGEGFRAVAAWSQWGWISDGDGLIYPTHWMPLPAPPKAAPEQEQAEDLP